MKYKTVVISYFNSISAHAVVPLGDVRLNEKDATDKIKEYETYCEKKKNKCNSSRIDQLKSPNVQQPNAKVFECKECQYTTDCRRNWWRHRQTQKHKSTLIL